MANNKINQKNPFEFLENLLKNPINLFENNNVKKERKFILNVLKQVANQHLKKLDNNHLVAIKSEIQIQSVQIGEFVNSLNIYLDQLDEDRNLNLIKLFQKIEQKPQAIINTIKSQIIQSQNIFREILEKLWYSYIIKKYKNLINQPQTLLIRFKSDVEFFKKFLADSIYYIFSNSLGTTQQEKNLNYYKILKYLIPQLITYYPKWKQIYNKILQNAITKTVIIKISATQDIFQIDQRYNCSQLQIPFDLTINILRAIHQQANMAQKVKKLKSLPEIIREEIKLHQKRLISKKLLNEQHLIDTDNIVACFQYCLYKLEIQSFLQGILLLDFFFSQQILSQYEISFLLASLKSAAETLRNRDERGKIKLNRRSYISGKHKSNINILSESMEFGRYFGFNPQCKFSHCFQFFSNRRIKCVQPTLISILTDIKIPKFFQLRVKIHQLKDFFLMVGMGAAAIKNLKQKDTYMNPLSVTYNIKNGQIYSMGTIIAGNKPKNKVNVLIVRIENQNISWILEDDSKCGISFQNLLKIDTSLYFHFTLSYQSEIQIFYN